MHYLCLAGFFFSPCVYFFFVVECCCTFDHFSKCSILVYLSKVDQSKVKRLLQQQHQTEHKRKVKTTVRKQKKCFQMGLPLEVNLWLFCSTIIQGLLSPIGSCSYLFSSLLNCFISTCHHHQHTFYLNVFFSFSFILPFTSRFGLSLFSSTIRHQFKIT